VKRKIEVAKVIENIAKKIVEMQYKYRMLFLVVMLGITLLLLPGVFRLVGNVEPSLEKVLPQSVDEVKSMNDMRAEFGADMMYVILYIDYPSTDIRDPRFVSYVDLLTQKVEGIDYVMQVDSISKLVKEDVGVISDSYVELKDVISKNRFASMYHDDDYSFTIIQIRTDTGAAAKIIKQVVSDIENSFLSLDEYNPGSNYKITGFNAIDKATFEVMMSDFSYITIFSMLMIMIVVLITFKSLSKGLLPMVVVMNSLLWTMGIAGYLGLTITVVSMVSAAMIMGLGIDFGIHVVYSYFHLRKKMSQKDAMKENMSELLRAMLGASLTTISGFLALLFGVLPAMKVLGIILSIGIFTTLVNAVMLLPVVVMMYDKRN
jgi:predicted RND superfamily exporter protein